MTREEHISNLEIIGCDGWTVTTEAYKSLQFAIKALKQEPCEDCISRKDLLNEITEIDYGCNMDIFTNEVREIVNELPSVKPIRPKGEWIKTVDDIFCSECWSRALSPSYWEGDLEKSNFCPTCGADMR